MCAHGIKRTRVRFIQKTRSSLSAFFLIASCTVRRPQAELQPSDPRPVASHAWSLEDLSSRRWDTRRRLASGENEENRGIKLHLLAADGTSVDAAVGVAANRVAGDVHPVDVHRVVIHSHLSLSLSFSLSLSLRLSVCSFKRTRTCPLAPGAPADLIKSNRGKILSRLTFNSNNEANGARRTWTTWTGPTPGRFVHYAFAARTSKPRGRYDGDVNAPRRRKPRGTIENPGDGSFAFMARRTMLPFSLSLSLSVSLLVNI